MKKNFNFDFNQNNQQIWHLTCFPMNLEDNDIT